MKLPSGCSFCRAAVLVTLSAACRKDPVPPGKGDDTEPPPATTSSTTVPVASPLCINELVPDNQDVLTDETGGTPDWIELANPGDADISLAGWSILDDDYDAVAVPLDPSLTVPARGYLVLYADASPELGAHHLTFALETTGGQVTLIAPDGRSTAVSWGRMAADLAVARAPDCCTGSADCFRYPLGGTPGQSNVASDATVVVLGAAATWRYWDQGGLPRVGWHTAGFDDATWPTGAAPLGYGDSPATQIADTDDASAPIATAYFRTTFTVPDPPAVGSARLRVRRDDGVGVFVNGRGVFWDNLPNVIGPDQLALVAVDGPDEEAWLEGTVWPGALVAGENTIAVEVHQAATDGGDLRFELELLTGP